MTTLTMVLEAAVPLWAAKIRGYTDQEVSERAYAAGTIIAHCGDALEHARPRKAHRNLIDMWMRQNREDPQNLDTPWKGEPSPGEVFNVIAEGIALADRLSPGGANQIFDMFLGKRPNRS